MGLRINDKLKNEQQNQYEENKAHELMNVGHCMGGTVAPYIAKLLGKSPLAVNLLLHIHAINSIQKEWLSANGVIAL